MTDLNPENIEGYIDKKMKQQPHKEKKLNMADIPDGLKPILAPPAPEENQVTEEENGTTVPQAIRERTAPVGTPYAGPKMEEEQQGRQQEEAEPSTAENQSRINRQNAQGQPINPRLASQRTAAARPGMQATRDLAGKKLKKAGFGLLTAELASLGSVGLLSWLL